MTASTVSSAPPRRRLGRRLEHYPANGARAVYLAITVLATIVLYYELYVQGTVATKIIGDLHMSLRYFIAISVIGNAIGAFASLAAGLADRWGRANLVVYGLGAVGLLILFGLPNAGSKLTYLLLFGLVNIVEGIVLVATPALIRDFSPQLGRASAMGFWTLGPVIGSVIVTQVSSRTLASHPDWQYQFRVAGIAGLVVFAVALIGLRELSPGLRDQLMVSLNDRALIEARAAGIDPEKALEGHWRQMLRGDIFGPALAISLFLLFYYIAVGFFIVYFATAFNYDEARANSLASWYWISNAIALVIVGALSDLIRVRKPFMLIGAVISGIGVAQFALAATRPATSYYSFAEMFVLIGVGGGMAFCAWMASFTETIERHNPAATATGLAVWGLTLRLVVTLALTGLIYAIPAANPLVDKGPKVQALATKYSSQLSTVALVGPETLTRLAANPADAAAQVSALTRLLAPQGVSAGQVSDVVRITTQDAQEIATAQAVDLPTLTMLLTDPTNATAGAAAVAQVAAKFSIPPAEAVARLRALAAVPLGDLLTVQTYGPKVLAAAARLQAVSSVPRADLAYLQANGPTVQKAQKDNPHQWQRYWWICFVGQLLFLPFIFLLKGRWSPRKAAEDARAHQEAVDRELAALPAPAVV